MSEALLGGAGVCLLTGIILARRSAAVGVTRLLVGLLPLALFGLLLACWGTFRLLPSWSWSACRLTAAGRIVRGLSLYTPIGGAAMNDWIYGPVGALAYTPAGLAKEPLTALRLAAWLNGFYFLLPAAALFAPMLRHPSTRAFGLAGFVFCGGALLAPFGTWISAAVLHVDGVAVALGVLSCLALARHHRLPLAAALGVLAVWTKQIALPLLFAQLLFLALAQGRPRAVVYFGWLAATGGLSVLIFGAWFGPATLWHNLVVIPGRHAWEWERLGSVLSEFGLATGWILPVAFVAWKWRAATPGPIDRDSSAGWLLLLAAAGLLPLGLLSALKHGSGTNSLHSIAYGILGGAMLLVRVAQGSPARVARFAGAALLAGLVGVLAIDLDRVVRFGHLTRPTPGQQHQVAYEFALRHPGQAYFPWCTLATLLAEGRDDPFEYGYHDWRLANSAPSPAALRAHLPSTLAFVIYHESDQRPFEMLGLFPDFSQVREAGGWLVFTRPTPAHPPAP